MSFPKHKTVSHLRIQILSEDSHVAGLVVPNDRTMRLPLLKESFNLNLKLLHYGETMGTTYKGTLSYPRSESIPWNIAVRISKFGHISLLINCNKQCIEVLISYF
jgi:hypothetical protein